MSSRLQALLNHSLLWRVGQVREGCPVLATGFPILDERLPGGGWPTQGLIEILLEHWCSHEMSLLLPALWRLSLAGGWVVFVSPPHDPYPETLKNHGIDVHRVLIIRSDSILWTLDQVLRSGCCSAVIAWLEKAQHKELRRLQVAAEKSRTFAVVFRPLQCRSISSPAMLRLALQLHGGGLRLTILKSRGGLGGEIDLRLNGLTPENEDCGKAAAMELLKCNCM